MQHRSLCSTSNILGVGPPQTCTSLPEQMAQVRLASHIRRVNFSGNERTGLLRYPHMAHRAVRLVRHESSAGTLQQGLWNFPVGRFGSLIVRQ
jgi:hypothetical protein